jgi:hypothetical protein
LADTGISEGLQRFVAQHIHSVEQLEVLLLLRKSPEREWTAGEVSRALSSHPHSVETRMLDLRARGLVASREGDREFVFRYAPEAGLDALVDELARAYGERRTSVINLIFSKPIDSVRTLAEAFRLRKKEEEK